MKLATVTSLPGGTDVLEVTRSGETVPVPVAITAVPIDQLALNDQVQVEIISRQVVLMSKSGGLDIPGSEYVPPPAGSITFGMLSPTFHATLAQGATDVILAQAAVQAGMIAVDAITGVNISDNSIEAPHIVANTITGAKIAADTISGDHIASFSISAAHAVFQAAAIKSADIESITATKISAGTIGAQTIILGGATSILKSSNYVAGSAGWQIAGDGSLEANTGTFRGALAAATGSFAGSLTAATGTFAGSLSAATGTFSGSLSAATGTFSGTLSAAGGTFTGTITASQISAGGTITGITFQTAASGQRIVVTTAGGIQFYNSAGSLVSTLQATGGGLLESSGSFNVPGTVWAYAVNVQLGLSYFQGISVGGSLSNVSSISASSGISGYSLSAYYTYTNYIYGYSGGNLNINTTTVINGHLYVTSGYTLNLPSGQVGRVLASAVRTGTYTGYVLTVG